jgi:hypothetical protein
MSLGTMFRPTRYSACSAGHDPSRSALTSAVLDADDLERLATAARERTERDDELLDALRADVRDHLTASTVIHPAASPIAAVAIGGAETAVRLDPYTIHFVRVADSLGDRQLLDVVSPSMDPALLRDAHALAGDAVALLMDDLGVDSLHALSPMIPAAPGRGSPSWVRAYLELCEWATLYQRICHGDVPDRTLLVRDGLLRSKVLARDLFAQMGERMCARIRALAPRKIHLAGIARRSRLLARYGAAIALEEALPAGRPRFANVPRELERNVYKHVEHTRRPDEGERSTFTIGAPFLARLGAAPWDPLCAIDLLHTQASDAEEIFGHLLADAGDGFPLGGYPRCLQRAREHAEPAELELAMLRRALAGAMPAAAAAIGLG